MGKKQRGTKVMNNGARRGRLAWAWSLLAVATAICVSVGACALLLPDRAPALLGSAGETTTAPASVQEYSGSQQVTVVPTISTERNLLGNANGTTAETYFEKNQPDVKLQKYDQYADAYNALLDGRGDAFSTDNTEVLAWAKSNKGFKVGITKLGDEDTIAPAVQKGNKELLNWLNDEIVKLGKENFFHKDYEETLKPVYGSDVDPDDIVVEGGKL